MNARTTALSALIACRKNGAWSDGIMKQYVQRDGLDKRDAALASRLLYGVLQNRMLLDHWISQKLNGKLSNLQPVVLDILRLAVYQLFCMDKIPPSAAVNEAVEQTKKYANRNASGLVNGVLRSMVRDPDSMTLPEDPALRYSHPRELVELLRTSMDEESLLGMLAADNEAPRTALQVNSLLASSPEIYQTLTENGVDAAPHPWLEGCFLTSGTGNLERLACFQDGKVYVQDAASRCCVLASGIEPGMKVLDCCAAPGGKSFAAAMQMRDTGILYSRDIHPHKVSLLEKGAQRLGIHIITTSCHDASVPDEQLAGQMDAVICDVPCSGLGIIRKKPDIRYKELLPMEQLPAIQMRILSAASQSVRPGGILMYSTCTVLKRENEQVVDAFLEAHPDFYPEAFRISAPLECQRPGMLTFLPGKWESDGFFICKMRRRS